MTLTPALAIHAPAVRRLTDRECQILEILANTGAGNAEIARHLQVSPSTIRTHVENVFRVIGVHSRGEAAAWAWRFGRLVPLDGAPPRIVIVSPDTGARNPDGGWGGASV
jgi:DNA-binding CsgD family transcriptional regulator